MLVCSILCLVSGAKLLCGFMVHPNLVSKMVPHSPVACVGHVQMQGQNTSVASNRSTHSIFASHTKHVCGWKE